ncbi:MAG TPA: PspC domain-containing protein [Actinomycetota bacterium]|nr:PspC domain-containing protein [Actinomycetota bacterium]
MARGSADQSGRKRSSTRGTQKGTASKAARSGAGRGSTAEQPKADRPSREDLDAERLASPVATDRVLRRSSDDRVLGGVCGGLGRYLGVDPVVLRIAFVILAFAGGSGILLYILAWILIPEERAGEPVGTAPRPERQIDLWLVVGVGLVALGIILLIDRLIPWFDKVTGPLILVAIGVAVLVQSTRR